MELKDTIELMTSDNYKERFKAEYLQLKIRVEGLRKMLIKWDAGKLDFAPPCPRATYLTQKRYMEEYLNQLEVRAAIEEIELE